MTRTLAALALPLLIGCHVRSRVPPELPPLSAEGEVRVYLQPFPEDAARLAVSLAGVQAVHQDGSGTPLELATAELGGADPNQRLIALGRLPPGPYAGVAIAIRRATLATEGRIADLLAPGEPVRVDVPFTIERGRAVVVRLSLDRGQAVANEFRFEGGFTGAALAPENSAVQLPGYCAAPSRAGIVVFDRHAHEVKAVIPTGRLPMGIALDPRALRAFVALSGDDQVQIVDLVTGEEVRRIPLRPGDEPRELALTPDGALAVVNAGSNSVSFVDPESGAVLSTARTGDVPSSLVLDRDGRRAYVLNRRSASITVLDLGNRVVVATAQTDPEPLAAQLSRDGTRLYLIAAGSAYLTIFNVPELTVARRVFVGLGAGALRVDGRTGLVYVGRADEARIQVFDPMSDLPVDGIALPGPVSYLAFDDVENALVAAIPSLRQLAFVDVARKRLVATVDVGGEPYRPSLLGERY
jgi:DNA-binding beta-propeller fold protein YncE